MGGIWISRKILITTNLLTEISSTSSWINTNIDENCFLRELGLELDDLLLDELDHTVVIVYCVGQVVVAEYIEPLCVLITVQPPAS